MSKGLTVVMDADGIIAQHNPDDIHHKEALRITKYLSENNAQVVYPTTAIVEAATHIQRVLNSTASAYGTSQVLVESGVRVAGVDRDTLLRALNFFSPTTSKKNTLFDCVVMAVADENKADAIFSFDKVYEKKGYKLAANLK